MARKRILFIGGSLNMTRMTHAVARHLQDEFDCWFSPFYADGLFNIVADNTSILDFTALGGNFRRQTDAYFRLHNLPIDYRGEAREYDLYVATTDLLVPKKPAQQALYPHSGRYDGSGRFHVPCGQTVQAAALSGQHFD